MASARRARPRTKLNRYGQPTNIGFERDGAGLSPVKTMQSPKTQTKPINNFTKTRMQTTSGWSPVDVLSPNFSIKKNKKK